MIIKKESKNAERILEKARKCAKEIFSEFVGTSDESRYEKAMEVALRLAGLEIELQRIVPVLYQNVALRDVRDELDIVVWIKSDILYTDRLAVVLELKVDGLPQDRLQLYRYIRSLDQVLNSSEAVYFRGLLINFPYNSLIYDESNGNIDLKQAGVSLTTVEVGEQETEDN